VPNVAVSEVHYHPSSPPGFQHDFDDGTTGGLVPVEGTWSVVDGQFQVVPVASEDTLATIPGLLALSNHFKIAVDVTIVDNPTLNNNAVIYFDYQGPENFKFASFHDRNDRWRLGTRDASGWNFISDNEAPVNAGTRYAIEVEIVGSTAILRADGAIKAAYDYGTPLQSGLVGLGSRKSQTRFDNLSVDPLGDPEDYEFVEITNTTEAAVDLAGWKLDGDVLYQFPANVQIVSGESMVVVGFNPDDAARLAEIRRLYGVEESVRFVGPYDNRLGNDGGVVRLLRPVVPLNPQTGFVLVDHVAFDDQSPWPGDADGAGSSLARIAGDAFGSLAENWTAGPPTPGEAAFAAAPGDSVEFNWEGGSAVSASANSDVDGLKFVALVHDDPEMTVAVSRPTARDAELTAHSVRNLEAGIDSLALRLRRRERKQSVADATLSDPTGASGHEARKEHGASRMEALDRVFGEFGSPN
jgi:hypothetical protein